MNIHNYYKHLTLSKDQETTLTKLEAFFTSSVPVFMLKGYAGSGKTTVLKGLLEYLKAEERPYMLMAPTGRAAKVIREKTGADAFTIHKSIYNYEQLEEVDDTEVEGEKSFIYYYKIRNNADVAYKIFIVDEASMISDVKNQGEFFRFGTDHLLTDLISFTRVGVPTANTKIIFIGDPCQLPPVGDTHSKAFDAGYLKEKFGLSSMDCEMKEVKRQGAESGILKAASKIRRCLSSGFFNDFDLRQNGSDIFNPTYERLLQTYVNTSGTKIIIASKNKTCLELNHEIRQLKFGDKTLPLQKGDIVIMGSNNYRKGIMNGEFAVINEVATTTKEAKVKFYPKANPDKAAEKKYAIEITLTWRKVELMFPGEGEEEYKYVQGQVLENFLYGDNHLTPEEMQALYVDFKNRHPGLNPKSEGFKQAIMNNEYFNCIQLKYGYAVTCHKAQGGEWDNAFTVWDNDTKAGFNCFTDLQRKEGKANASFYRWAYTAVTRAAKQLFAVNPPYFNSYSTLSLFDANMINGIETLKGASIQPEAIILDEELLSEMAALGVDKEPLELQDHFIKVRMVLRKKYIEVVGWQRKGFDIWYLCQREGNTAGLRTSFNGKNIFNGKYLKLPPQTNSDSLFEEAQQAFVSLPNVIVQRNTVETIITQIEFDLALEERYPFLKNLYDDMEKLLTDASISIDDIEHLQWRERYKLKRGDEKATLDIIYKVDGFFSQAVPVTKECNSQLLLQDIMTCLKTLKAYATEPT